MNNCKTCIFRDKHGFCQNKKLDSEDYWQTDEKKSDMLICSYQESGSFWVGDDFGCVHHRCKSKKTKAELEIA